MSNLLAIPLLDKDNYLETLFDTRGYADADRRHSLSREADQLFQRDAESKDKVILVSHWRPRDMAVDYGTPSEWLADIYPTILEIYCVCPSTVAASRFLNRVRHQGHVDGSRTPAEVALWLQDYDAHLPIAMGKCISINTEGERWKDDVSSALKRYL